MKRQIHNIVTAFIPRTVSDAIALTIALTNINASDTP